MMWLHRAGFVAAALLLGIASYGQSTCGLANPDLGMHICFPPEDQVNELPPVIHISAQINAPADQVIKGFTILVDNLPVGEEIERVPTRQVSVEGNLGAPLSAGKHLVTIKSPGFGEATAKIVVGKSEAISACDPITNFPQWVCVARSAIRGAKEISPFAAVREKTQKLDLASLYGEYEEAFLHVLEALQLDTMDVAAFDRAGNLYVATHVHSDIEVRKYSVGGQKLEFATVISACGPGFTTLDAMAVNDQGQVWIAGRSQACFHASEHAFQKDVAARQETTRAFVLSLRTRPGSSPPLQYFTYLSVAGEQRVRALRVDNEGNAYLTGTTSSADFPHQSSLTLNRNQPDNLSFVTLLNSAGSSSLHSTLLRGVFATALDMRADKSIFIAGQTHRFGFIPHPLNKPNSSSSLSSDAKPCCTSFAAVLTPDLSGINSARLLSGSPVASSSSLSITSDGDVIILTVPFKVSRQDEKTDAGADVRSLYAWRAETGSVCSRTLPYRWNPALIDAVALDLFAADVRSPICASLKRSASAD